jgi:hypothetical protein
MGGSVRERVLRRHGAACRSHAWRRYSSAAILIAPSMEMGYPNLFRIDGLFLRGAASRHPAGKHSGSSQKRASGLPAALCGAC